MDSSKHTRIVWCFTDGKPGHVNQTQGLVRALSEKISLQSFNLQVISPAQAIWAWIFRSMPVGQNLPNPDLIIGAGHATHLSMLAARRARGGKVVVLMKPSLPLSWFDLCIIPQHDGDFQGKNILQTRGVLNRIVRGEKIHNKGIILIGGPSAHYDWDESSLISQLDEILKKETGIHWILTTSRRTPDSTVKKFEALNSQNLELVPWQKTDADWLPAQLASAGLAWITEDSVSMVYEAVTSGAQCGLLEIPHKTENRITRGLQILIDEKFVTPFKYWQQKGQFESNNKGLNEASRCADWVISNITGR